MIGSAIKIDPSNYVRALALERTMPIHPLPFDNVSCGIRLASVVMREARVPAALVRAEGSDPHAADGGLEPRCIQSASPESGGNDDSADLASLIPTGAEVDGVVGAHRFPHVVRRREVDMPEG
jgi:hypothetical protein